MVSGRWFCEREEVGGRHRLCGGRMFVGGASRVLVPNGVAYRSGRVSARGVSGGVGRRETETGAATARATETEA